MVMGVGLEYADGVSDPWLDDSPSSSESLLIIESRPLGMSMALRSAMVGVQPCFSWICLTKSDLRRILHGR